MEQLIKTALEDVAECFGIEEDLYQKYYVNEILKNEELASLIEDRNDFGDWKEKTPLGGPGTVLNGVVLYCLIKYYDIQDVLETGVSGGFYSAFMLAAAPYVTSVEISEDLDQIGNMVPKKLKEDWDLITGTDSLSFFKEEGIPAYRYELYCHDSLHTMSHMTKELLEFKKCVLDRFFVYIDDQDTDLFWRKCIQMGAFKKPGYNVKYISGNESRLKGHLGGFIRYVKTQD